MASFNQNIVELDHAKPILKNNILCYATGAN